MLIYGRNFGLRLPLNSRTVKFSICVLTRADLDYFRLWRTVYISAFMRFRPIPEKYTNISI